ncbi:phosphatidylinositol transporter [Paramyrothecium foliicola]|nr:phosphatidylinositol transporter [Paramyrothecium foliicola]
MVHLTMSADAAAPPPVARVQSSVSISDISYPNAHLGHLTPHQEEALDQFKALLQERGAWKPGPPPSHDDGLLLRFLRARRWVPEDAYTQFKDTEDWRAANDIDVLYHTIELDAYEQSRRLYPQWTGRRDRRGIPLYVYEVRTLDSKTVSEYEKLGANKTFSDAKTDGKTPSGLLRLFALYENLTRFNMPFCTQLTDREHPEVPITMSTNIVDISGVGLKQFWNLKSHMQAASTLATAHYPETLDRIFIIGAPSFFGTVWGWIKRWFDPNTVSKIFILNPNEVMPTLEAFIEPRNIPKRYGGELDYEFGSLASTDPAWDGVVRWENGHSSFPGGPLVWEDVTVDGEDRLACIALGSKGGQKQKVTVCTIPRTYPAKAPVTNGVAAEEQAAPVATEEKPVAGTVASTQTTAAGDVTEGTQTTAYETHDDAVQTDLSIASGEAIGNLTINDEKTKSNTGAVSPAIPTTVA